MIGIYTLRNRPDIQRLFIGIFILFAASTAQAELRPFKLQYQAENDFISAGTATLSLVKEQRGWVMRLATSPSTLVRMAGVGKIVETTLLSANEPPFKAVSYSYNDSKRKRKSFSAVRTNSGENIVITRSDQTITVSTSDQIVSDRLSAILAVAKELYLKPNFKTLDFTVLDRNGVRKLVFKNLGLQSINLGDSSIDTYVVESGRPGSSRTTRTWFASLDKTLEKQIPLPVKIEQYKNDDLIVRLSLVESLIQE